MEAYHVKTAQGNFVTIPIDKILCIDWIFSETVNQEPDKCTIHLVGNKSYHLWREHTEKLYRQIRGE